MPLLKEALISGVLAQYIRRKQSTAFAGLALMGFAGFIFTLAVIFLSLACYNWLLTLYPPAGAWGITAAALAVVSLAFLLFGRAEMHKISAVNDMESHQEIAKLITLVTEELPHELAVPVKENPKTALALALITGLIAGNKIR
jgi:hypothetical protein